MITAAGWEESGLLGSLPYPVTDSLYDPKQVIALLCASVSPMENGTISKMYVNVSYPLTIFLQEMKEKDFWYFTPIALPNPWKVL